MSPANWCQDTVAAGCGDRFLFLIKAVWMISVSSLRRGLPVVCGLAWAACWSSELVKAADPPRTANEVRLDELAKSVREKVAKFEVDSAMADANAAIAVEAEHRVALTAMGIALAAKGDLDGAIKQFDKAVTKGGATIAAREERAEAYTQKAIVLHRQREFLAAIDSCYFASLEKYDYAPARLQRCASYIARGDFQKAINHANVVIYQKNPDPKPEDVNEAMSLRGNAYLKMGNVDQAIADGGKGTSPAALYRLSEAYAVKGDYAKSLAALDSAISARPNFLDALCDRAVLLGMKRDFQKASADLDAVVKADPNFARGHYMRGMAYQSAGNHDEAIKNFNEAIRVNQKYGMAYIGRAGSYMGKKEKDNDLALADLTKAIEVEPKLKEAYAARAALYTKLKKGKEARADQEKLASLSPAPAKKPDPKKTDKPEDLPRFVVSPKPVNPKRTKEMLEAAKEIDRLIVKNYEKHSIQPLARTTDEQFIRRVYLDITGTIPTLAQVRKFLNNAEANKRSALIDELLASPGYASHYFNYWADVLRYVDGLNGDVRGEAYRQWIKQSLAENKPWDKMVHEMMTASGHIWDAPATGYFQRDPNMPLDVMNNTVRIFVGTRIGCAQCHDHPFDRWTQKEFYQMAAFTFGTMNATHGGDQRYWSKNPNERLSAEYAEIEQEEEDRRNNQYTFDRIIRQNMMILNDIPDRKIKLPKDYQYANAKPEDVVEPKTLFGSDIKPSPGETPRQTFARWLTGKDNPRFALVIANRLWKQAFGVGQIEPVDDMMDQTVAENPELMSFLTEEMKRLDFDMKEYLRTILNTEVYQRQACSDEVPLGAPYHFPGPMLRRMTAEQTWDSFLTLAVVDPEEYRELPATVRNAALSVDLTSAPAKDVLAIQSKLGEIDYSMNSRRQQKYMYKGTLLARASELPSPAPPNHFLRMFGQSDRELISASSTNGSVPQILLMFNGPFTHMLLEKNSTMYNNVMKSKNVNEQIKTIFLTILARVPDEDETNLAKEEIKRNGAAGYGNVIWSLVNTREFLFIQ